MKKQKGPGAGDAEPQKRYVASPSSTKSPTRRLAASDVFRALAVFDGQVYVGRILPLGKAGFEAFDAADRPIGTFSTMKMCGGRCHPSCAGDNVKLALIMPRRGRGRQSVEANEQYERELLRWCAGIRQIASTIDFKVSSRGWCYILEEHGLEKGDFDVAQRLINDCRKRGFLPLDICSEDEGRAAEHVEDINAETPKEFAQKWLKYLRNYVHEQFTPISFWGDLDVYIQMTVEKVDLRSLFSSVCKPFRLPLMNISGWNDINTRVAIMRRFKYWEAKGKRIVLLHCGDHDPGGLHISGFLRSNLEDLSDAVGWSPDNLRIDRFGLNADFIRKNRLTWIDNLKTGSGGDLTDPEHNDAERARSILAPRGARRFF